MLPVTADSLCQANHGFGESIAIRRFEASERA
jgi:hypothetical protein